MILYIVVSTKRYVYTRFEIFPGTRCVCVCVVHEDDNGGRQGTVG